MISFFQLIAAIVLLCPFIILLVIYMIGLKIKLPVARAFGYAADVTTVLLFASIALAVESVWQVHIFVWMIILAIIVAMIFTYIDWRTKKEIKVPPLLRRIWRFYFIALVIVYFAVLVVGITFSVFDYVKVV